MGAFPNLVEWFLIIDVIQCIAHEKRERVSWRFPVSQQICCINLPDLWLLILVPTKNCTHLETQNSFWQIFLCGKRTHLRNTGHWYGPWWVVNPVFILNWTWPLKKLLKSWNISVGDSCSWNHTYASILIQRNATCHDVPKERLWHHFWGDCSYCSWCYSKHYIWACHSRYLSTASTVYKPSRDRKVVVSTHSSFNILVEVWIFNLDQQTSLNQSVCLAWQIFLFPLP